jgi:hypothetical protein
MNSKKNPSRDAGGFDEIESYGDLLPQQYYDIVAGPRRGNGARDLMLAVLEDGIRAYVTNIAGRTSHQRRLFDEAKAWIEARGDRAPFSFETICETFDIEPGDLRRRLSTLPADKFRPRLRTPKRSKMVKAA